MCTTCSMKCHNKLNSTKTKINYLKRSLQSESFFPYLTLQNLAKFGRESEREEGKRETWIFQCGLSREENSGIISYIGTIHS